MISCFNLVPNQPYWNNYNLTSNQQQSKHNAECRHTRLCKTQQYKEWYCGFRMAGASETSSGHATNNWR